ncbi:hypothetical protein MSG28_004849 [Choristoneura fumiferana]|uniref:Uncharacterized protein n=2 Tax=Choristoneura fumiferana TaxID=7141 RepID=A0ACC0K7K3_CHOFU|nr:hypothetical protein MSG28_004849 [Choristoneura fumiferana]
MRSGGPRYPVDRYLVESSNKIEMVNIIDDIWNPEPALRPEEEIILRKLHEMLQSTADDLKLLSGELARTREPGIQVRAAPAPLDEEFNEKVHIEEVVNAKFHGFKIVDKAPKLKKTETNINKPQKNVRNENIQLNSQTVNKKPTVTKKLTMSRTNVVQINQATQGRKFDKVEDVQKPIKQTIAYNEFSFQYPQPKVENLPKGLKIQTMPGINIRSELKAQKVLLLDIVPEIENSVIKPDEKANVAVITMKHDIPPLALKDTPIKIEQDYPRANVVSKKQTRKVTQMLTCESSTSTNNGSSLCNLEKTTIKYNSASSKKSVPLDRNKIKKNVTTKAETAKRTHINLDEWKKKLNSVYGQPSSSRINKFSSKPKTNVRKSSPKKTNIPPSKVTKPHPNILNNAQYIPYSQLTVGGVNVSDIEKEISNIPNKNDIPLSPILDRIISSRENSQHNSPRKEKQRESPKILTTSDENLLREVIDIEKAVNKTLSQNVESKMKVSKSQIVTSDSANEDTNELESYADDFEDEKSERSEKQNLDDDESHSDDKLSNNMERNNESIDLYIKDEELQSRKNKTNIKSTKKNANVPKLSLKKRVDVYEYVHAIDTQDIAIQSQTTNKISLKETQTSPRNESTNKQIEPIHNDLWPAMDPSKEIENMFKLEKHLIKKFIMDEYGDILQSTINKPSTSKENQDSLNSGLNLAASQKVTQTSPKHVKSVMTSPTQTKTRTTSPFLLSVPVDHQTSPMIFVNDEKEKEIEQDPEDLGISINMSSPRFSLRLPNTSVEVLSNLEICSRSPSNVDRKNVTDRKIMSSAKLPKPVIKNECSTSVDADNSSSELSSLGEVKLKLKRRSKKSRVFLSESSSSSKLSVDFDFGSILPLKSEGEASSSHIARSRKSSIISSKSDGEMSLGRRQS